MVEPTANDSGPATPMEAEPGAAPPTNPDAGALVQAGDPALPAGSEIAELLEYDVDARTGLRRERDAALEKKSRDTGWLVLFGFGPATLAAIVLALVFDQPELVLAFAGLGAGVQLTRVIRDHLRLRRIERELEDPIDGS